MAGDSLSIGTSALLAFQRALTTSSHNISNVNTPGYSRQQVDFATRPGQGTGTGFIGAGVQTTTVERMYDQFLIGQVRTHTSSNSQLQTFHRYASEVDNLLSDPEAGLTPSLQEFFDAAQGVADAPSSIPARQVMLTQAQSLVDRFHYLHERLDSLNDAVNTQLTSTVDEVNGLAGGIARLNADIVLQSKQFGQPPNDLLDQRDELVRQLSEKVSVSTVPQDDGALNVFIGKGQTLVVGNRASSLMTRDSALMPGQLEVALRTATGASVDIGSSLTGGALGGALAFRSQALAPALNQLGRVAVGMAQTFNAQHVQGMDLNGKLGTQFFAPPSVAVDADPGNTGSGAVSGVFGDVSALSASDYRLRYDGANQYTLTRQSDGQTSNIDTGGSSPYTTAAIDGFTLTLSAGASVGDSFYVRPTRDAARDLRLTLSDPQAIAAAGAVRASADTGNRGDAQVSPGVLVTDSADPGYVASGAANFMQGYDVAFRTGGSGSAPYADEYSVDGGASWNAYSSGADITLNGMRVQVSGTPFDGDRLRVEANISGSSDNRNALALAGLQTKRQLNGGTADYQGAYGQLVADVGTRTHQAEVNSTAEQGLLDQAVASRESVSGVNLDEEAANLLRFQQAYQAAAKVVSTSSQLFQVLLGALGR